MVALVSDRTDSARRFVAEFNQSLAAAKVEALALLRSFIAGNMPGGGDRTDRERRLAASQVLRTPFLRIDDQGEVRNDHRRSRATDSGGRNRCSESRSNGCDRPPEPSQRASERIPPDLAPVQNPAVGPVTLCESDPISTASRRAPDMGLADATHGTPIQVPVSPPQDPTHTTQDPSVSSVLSVVNPNSSGETRLAQLESMRADLARAPRGLCGADQKRIIKQALADLRAKARAPT